jgi:hypothetical protein
LYLGLYPDCVQQPNVPKQPNSVVWCHVPRQSSVQQQITCNRSFFIHIDKYRSRLTGFLTVNCDISSAVVESNARRPPFETAIADINNTSTCTISFQSIVQNWDARIRKTRGDRHRTQPSITNRTHFESGSYSQQAGDLRFDSSSRAATVEKIMPWHRYKDVT